MPSPFADFLAFEQHFETAAAARLKAAGFRVFSGFIPAEGTMPDECCWVVFETGDCDDTVRAFRVNPDGEDGIASAPAGYEGTLEVWHRVGEGDRSALDGAPPACYAALCRERARIRELFLDDVAPFHSALPLHDILSIRLVQPARSAERERSANLAVERFRLRFMPSALACGTADPEA